MSGNEDDRSMPPPSYSEAISDPRYMASGATSLGSAMPPYPSLPQGQPVAAQSVPSGYQALPTSYQSPPTSYQAPPTSYHVPPASYQATLPGVQSTSSTNPYPVQSGYPTQTTITYNPCQGNVQCGNLPQGFATTPLAYGNSGHRQDATRFNKICITVICCFVVVSVFIFTMAMALGMH